MYMKKLVTLSILIPTLSFGQTIAPPYWGKETISFETAKIKQIIDVKMGKYGPETFKTCKILITDENLGLTNLTIDMPDIFFLKEADMYSMTYEKTAKDNVSVSYNLIKDKINCVIAFVYPASAEKPEGIIVTFKDRSNGNIVKMKQYLLTELK